MEVSELKQRIISGVIAGAGFILLLWLGDIWFAGAILLLAWLGFDEFLRMNGLRKHKWTAFLGHAGTAALVIPWDNFGLSSWFEAEQVIWVMLFVLLAITVTSKNQITIDQMAMFFIGMVYVGIGFHYMIETRLMDNNGLFWTLLIFICIWASDSGAYFVGSAIGKRPLWQTISPKKSIEGAVGGVVISILAALCFAYFRPDLVGYAEAVYIGAVTAVVGQLGDLMQSAYKRVKGIKDSGSLIPGHGGVLDRTDSWLIVFPFLHLLSFIPNAG